MTMILRINCDEPMAGGTCGVHAHGPTADLDLTLKVLTAAGWGVYAGGEHRCPFHARRIRNAR
jgi:hypothetical protein